MATIAIKRAQVVAQDKTAANRLRSYLEHMDYVVELRSRIRPGTDVASLSTADLIIYHVSREAAQAERRHRWRPRTGRTLSLADFWMDSLHQVCEWAPTVPILVTLPAGVDAADAALEIGATDVLQDPVTPGMIRRRIEMLEAFIRSSAAAIRNRLEPRPALRAVDPPLPALRSGASGRLDAHRVADYMGIPLRRLATALGLPYAGVHKTPDAPRVQAPLAPIARVLELAAALLNSREAVRMWLNRPLRELAGESPLEVILAGEAGAVETLLANARAGIPG
jgi:Protein of unknown function (DUF2384)